MHSLNKSKPILRHEDAICNTFKIFFNKFLYCFSLLAETAGTNSFNYIQMIYSAFRISQTKKNLIVIKINICLSVECVVLSSFKQI